MRSIIRYFINNSLAANLLMVAIFLLGLFGAFATKKTFFPKLGENIIVVQAAYLGAAPAEIEEGIATKIEESVKGVTGIDRVTSKSLENRATVMIEIDKNADIDEVLRDVKNAVDAIPSFPVGMEALRVYKQEILLDAINFAISGPVNLRTLKKYARDIEEDLLALDGISKVNLKGFPDEEIEIAFREADLRTYQISITQATQAIKTANLDITGGTIKGEKEELLLRAKNKGFAANEFRNIVLKSSPGGSVVRLYQVADVRDKWVDNPNRSYINGEPGVVINVQYTKEEDIVEVADKVKAYIREFESKNEVIKTTVIKDESIVITQRINLLTENGILGFFLVILLLAMFLNWRLAFWVALAIPISFAGMFIFVPLFGQTINVVSSFGMIMVLGILVDDGIVICESIYSKYEQGGLSRTEAAIQGTMEVLPAVTGAILTTILAFGGFFFIDGQMGEYFSSMAVFVIFALLFSLIEGALILPTHVAHSNALDPHKKKRWVVKKLDGFMSWLKDKVYAPALKFSINNKFFVFSLIAGLFILTIAAIRGGIIKQTAFPNVEINDIRIDLKMPAGTREDITKGWLDHIEKAAWEVNQELVAEYIPDGKPIIEKVQKNIGPTTYEGSMTLILLDIEQRTEVGMRKISEAIRKKAGQIPGAESLTYGSFLSFGKPVSLALVGENEATLDKATREVKQRMTELEELRDIVDNNQAGLKEIKINLNNKAHFLGLSLQEVAGQVRQGFFGSEVQRLQRGRDEVRVWVRYAEEDRKNIQQLRDMRIRLADGSAFPLSEIASLELEQGVIAINRLEGRREIRIDSDISSEEVSVTDIVANLEKEIIPEVLASYPGVEAIIEGQNRELAKSNDSFAVVYPIVLLLMFFVIALTFKSISQTLVVFLLIPFCYIGVGWGHFFMDKPITILSNQGMLALIGILVNDTLVFVSTYNQNLKNGIAQMEALYQAGLSRFRPIVLTSVTTVAGLAPLLLDDSMGAQFVIPMAISVAFGLLFITVVILILLPIFLIAFNRVKVYTLWLWDGIKPSYESVERAVKNKQQAMT